MSYSGDAAEQVVRLTLEGVEVAAKIAGTGTKEIAVLLYAILRDQKKTKGKTRLTNMLRNGKELKVFAVKDTDLQRFCQEAKKYGVLYCVLKDKNANDGITDIMVRAEDASKINRIFERFQLATVDLGSVKSEIERSRAETEKAEGDIAAPERTAPEPDKDEQFLDALLAPVPNKEEGQTQNPTEARVAKSRQSEPTSTPKEPAARGKVMYAAEDISHDAAHLAGSGIKKAANKGKEEFQRQRAEKPAEKMRERSPASEPPASEQPSPTEHWQPPSSAQTDTPNVSPAEQSKAPVTERPFTPQIRPVRQGYQPVSTGDSGTTLYSDADRMVEQGQELAKKKAKQKAKGGKQIKQQTDKIAHQPEQTAKTTDASSGLRHTGETIQAAERPAQFTGKPVHGVKAPVRSMERSARAAKQTTQAARRTSGLTKQAGRTVEQSANAIKQTAKSTGKATAKNAKGIIKTSERTVKTAHQTSKAAIKTAQVTAKTAKKNAQATTKVARAASAAAKAMAKAAAVTAKNVAKAVAAAGKAIIVGSKALIVAIAAGGWVAVLAIVIICMIGLIVSSSFGIFFSSEDTGCDQTMYEVVREINTDYDNQLESIKLSHSHDEVGCHNKPPTYSVYPANHQRTLWKL